MTLAECNAMDEARFVAALGGVFEHSPWVAQRAYAARPFASVDELHAAMTAVVSRATEDEKLALLRAHPELAGKAMVAQALTAESTHEQGTAGLTQCTAEEFATLQRLNAAYNEKFGFPFIIAVKGLDRAGIIEAFVRRSGNLPEAEAAEALRQVGRITGLRLAALVQD